MTDIDHISNLGIMEIEKMPTSIKRGEYQDASGIHESVLRSYHIVRKVRWLLRQGTPASVILSLMDDMDGGAR